MRTHTSFATLIKSALAASALLLGTGISLAQTVNLTAGPTSTTLPDGQIVPMWGYSCGTATGATCSALSPAAAASGATASNTWSPIKIVVPYSTSASATALTIKLTNNLPAALPTSLVIAGQLGGGLGTGATTAASPTHNALGVTWFTSSAPGTNVGGVSLTSGGAGYAPLTTTVSITGGGGSGALAHAAFTGGVVTSIVVDNPGTGYTSAPTVTITDSAVTNPGHGATATASLADISGGAPTFTPPLQPQRVQSLASEVGTGATATLNWANLRPGTYLIQSGTQAPIQVPMGLYGVLVVSAPAVAYPASTTSPGVAFDADVPLVFSEIDAVQNQSVATAVVTPGFSPGRVWSGQPGQCGDPASPTFNTCFPPVVNYDPRYYLINGVSFDRTNLGWSTQQILPAPAVKASGTVLLRLVNAGLRMHVPAVVGRTMTLFAEDGNLLPGLPRQQSEVFMAAGKTYDVGITPKLDTVVPTNYAAATLPVYDRQLSLSTNNQRDGGMLAYVSIAGGASSGAGTSASKITAQANADSYFLVPGKVLAVAEAAKGVIANDVGVYGVTVLTAPGGSGSTLSLNADGTFTYMPGSGVTSDTFTYCANGTVTGGVCSSGLTAKVTLAACGTGCLGGAPTASAATYNSNIAVQLKVGAPGLILNASDPSGLPLTAAMGSSCTGSSCLAACPPGGPFANCVAVNSDGSFKAYTPGSNTYQFAYLVKNSQGTPSAEALVSIVTQPGSNLQLNITGLTATKGLSIPITDYRWIIEEDKTWYADPLCQINKPDPRTDSHGNTCPPLPVESLAYSFHTTSMPVVATGCVGTVSCEQGQSVLGVAARCDLSNGQCRTDASSKDPLDPKYVALDPKKRYFLSILPGDAINPTLNGQGGPVTDPGASNPRPFSIAQDCPGASDFALGSGQCGHGMGGTSIGVGQTAVNVILQPTPLPTAQIAAFVYQDDNPLNGENDAGGGVDVLAPNEPGLGGFELKIFDQAGGLGDPTGQVTYDMFNYPVSNALANTIDPISGQDACPISARGDGLVGMIPTCPKYEADGKTLSPLAGQAVIKNLYPGLYEIVATPGADRIGRGEEWLQTNTLDGGRAHEASIKPNEPAYFQEFGPGGFHVSIGFANPAIINGRLQNGTTGLCDPQSTGGGGLTCPSSLTVNVTKTHMSRTPDQRVFSTGSYDAYNFTNCYVAMGPPDGADFAFAKCDANGSVTFNNIPNGDWKLVVFDQWNDITLDGLVNAVGVHCTPVAPATTCDDTKTAVNATQEFPVTQWRTNIYTRTYLDRNGDGTSSHDLSGKPCTAPNVPAGCNANYGNDTEPGLTLVATNIRYRDGSFGFFNNTDLNGYANFNEVFPFMNWLVVEADTTRFKTTSVHSVYDTGGPVDGSSPNGQDCGAAGACGKSTIASRLANTLEQNSLPKELRVPGAVYCADADCLTTSVLSGAYYTPGGSSGPTTGLSSGRIDPPMPWGTTQAWQGLLGQTSFIEFGMKPFVPHENGGIKGHVIYASTRPFDDPMLLLQLSWEPGVPRVKINLYQEGTAADGTTSLKLVDTTTSTSFDDWAQGFRKDANGNLISYTDPKTGQTGYIPNMNCPGQAPDSPFFATLQGSRQFLDPARNPLAANSQFKCFDGWAMLNQVQPAPYDGMYKFPSVVATDPKTGRPAGIGTAINPAGGSLAGSNCTVCVANPDDGNPMLPAGKYVVEVIVPSGFELVKEEDKNILMGDIYVAPVATQFTGLGAIFIMPDQAQVNAAYNKNNPLNATNALGSVTFPRHEGDTGSIETYWPCVGAMRTVPDFNSLFPSAQQNAPFAGALRPLCDRKEVTLQEQASALAKFYIFTPTHIAGHFTGTITNDLASEFDPFSPQFGEKFGPPNLPVGMRDFTGTEVNRVYSDQWGVYNGLFTSSWEVNPPNPTGYAPTMAIACMNDPGPIPDPSGAIDPSTGNVRMMIDPAYNPAYSNFCYETPFMPGFTAYMDTPVVPVQAFADQYNLPDAEYPDGTPAIKTVVNSDGSAPQGPWVTLGSAGTPATVTFTLDNVTSGNPGDSINQVSVGATTLLSGPVHCTGANACTNLQSLATRNARLATLLANAINARTGTTGYSATSSAATVTITAPAAAANGTGVAVSQTGVTILPNVPLALAGGAPAVPGQPNLTITALGDKVVLNPAFSGPNASTAPYNQKTITRHYGFGSRPSLTTCPTTGACQNVTVGGVPMTDVGWSDTSITGTVPAGLPLCSVGNPSYKGANASAQCGQLVITAANGKSSIDTVTVTAGGTAPWIVTTTGVTPPAGKSIATQDTFGRTYPSLIQTAIDNADPGDLILVGPGAYKEHLLMWKPVRLQGVGAAAVTINADGHPAGVLDQWRRQLNCVFGLQISGVPSNGGSVNTTTPGTTPPVNNFDPSGVYSCPDSQFLRADRIPFEALVGWDATGNGNLAQVLQEPTLMGAYEGAGVTVLGRGAKAPDSGPNQYDLWGQNATGGAGAFTDGSTWLTSADCTPNPNARLGRDYSTSNYYCNPSRVDGMAIINSSQGGGGVFIHGWAHNLELSNTRISANQGTLSGAINLGNGETPDAYINDNTECGAGLTGAAAVMPCPPIPATGQGSTVNSAIPFLFNANVHIHHNAIVSNASIGDALFSGTPAGAGGITISAGSDNYKIDHNWIAGNLTSGDGGGIQHVGLSFNGSIDHNWVLFNQSTNPTLPTNGGGIAIMGANVDRTVGGNECGSVTDVDCTPGIGEGAGGGLVVDANLILGNSAESGSGGGLRLQQINGTEVAAFAINPGQWYDVTVTNNVIVNNVAGWDGAGVSLEDTLKAKIVNNTIASNDTTASAGVLFKTLGAVNASSPPPGCDPAAGNCPSGGNAKHVPQPAGLVTVKNTPNMISSLTGVNALCPAGYGYSGGFLGTLVNANCRLLSLPMLTNNLFWQNRAFHVDITSPGSGLQSQQNLVGLFPLLNQNSTGFCATSGLDKDLKTNVPTNFWDVGVRDDVKPNDGAGGAKLSLTNSILTPGVTYGGTGNLYPSSSPLIAQYCNGSRIPPEGGGHGYNAPAGRSETTGLSTIFVFNGITPAVTVDEGNNWINLTYGPLTLTRPGVGGSTNAEMMLASAAYGTAEGAYSVPGGSPAVSHGAATTGLGLNQLSRDFFGNPRSSSAPTIGAVEYVLESFATLRPTDLEFGNVSVNSTSAVQTLTLSAGSSPLTVTGINVSGPFAQVGGAGACSAGGGTLAASTSCTISVVFNPTAPGAVTGAVTILPAGAVADSPVGLTGTGVTTDLSVSPSSLAFAAVYAGQPSAVQMLTLSNNTNPAKSVSGIALTISGPFVRSGGTCPTTATFSLGVGAPCTVGITMQTTTPGAATGSVTVAADAGFSVGGSPVALAGTVWGLPVATPAPLNFGTVVSNSAATTQTLTLSNPANGTQFTFTSISVTGSQFSRPSGAAGGTCGTTLAANANCTIVISFLPGATLGTASGQVAFVGGNAPTVTNAPVPLTGNVVAPSFTASVTPSPLAFGNWASGTTSSTLNLTVTNTGNQALAGGSFNFTGSAPFSRVTSGAFPSGAPNCGATLAVGATCTVKVQFAPTSVATFNRTLTVAYTGTTVTPAPVQLSGTGVGTRATLSVTPNPMTITLPSGTASGTGTVTLTNNAAVGGAQAAVSSVAVTGGALFNYFFNAVAGSDNCTGATLAPGASCTVVVRFTNVTSPRGANRPGTITFTDNGAPASGTQTGNLIGFATP